MSRVRLKLAVIVAGILIGAAGCGSSEPRTYAVQGSVKVARADVSHLAGSLIEAVSDGDPAVRASGEIQPDGSFSLESLDAGIVRSGAREGTYRVRIILNDDDGPSRKRAARAVAQRYQRLDTSGLTIRVPPPGDVELCVSAK
jgi:hypothetical protein